MPWWFAILIPLLKAVSPTLGRLITVVVQRIIRDMENDQNILDITESIVVGIEKDHPDWDGPKKFAFAADAVRQYAKSRGYVLDDDMVNTLIDVSVMGTVNADKLKG